MDGRVSRFAVEKFFFSQRRRGSEENPLVFPKLRVSKNIRDKSGSWGSQFSVEIVLPHSTETFPKGNLLCCASENFPGAKKFMEKKEWCL